MDVKYNLPRSKGGTSFKGLGYEDFDPAESYAAGDVVVYNNGLKKFTTSHEGAWDDEDATDTTIEEIIGGKAAQDALEAHEEDMTLHVTPSEKELFLNRQTSLDFGAYEDTISIVNTFGAININRVVGDNVATVKLSHGSTIQQAVTLGDADIDVDDGETMIFEITRTADGSNAALGVRFTIVTNE